MHRRRGGNGYGPNPISFADINGWQHAMQYPLRPWEVEAVTLIDDAYLAIDAEKAEERATKGTKP